MYKWGHINLREGGILRSEGVRGLMGREGEEEEEGGEHI